MATPNTANGSLLDCQSPFVIKLVLLGGYHIVGKSSLVTRFVFDKFRGDYQITLGHEFLTKTINVNNRTVKFMMWDTGGVERYRSLVPSSYRNAQAAIVVYDITNMDSFTTAKSWVKELRNKASPNIVIALSGNMADLVNNREVQFEEAQVYAQENNLLFMETSALTAQNVTEIFVAVAMKTLQAYYEENGWSPLMVASQNGHLEAVMALIGSGTEVNHTDKNGWSPLMVASQNGHLEAVLALIRSGTEVNHTDKGGWSSLMIASEKGHLDIMKTLIGAGAEVSLTNENGWSPLMVASQNGHLEAVVTLIVSVTEVNHIDKDIKKALHVAAKSGHTNVVQLLEACKTKIFRQQFHDMYERKEQQIRQQKEETEKQLQDVKQQKEETEKQLPDVWQQKEETEKQLQDVRQQKKETEKQLRDARQQSEQTEQQLDDMRQQKEQAEQQLDVMRQQKEQAEQQLHDMRQQKEQAEQQLHDMRQQKGEMKEQIDAYEKKMKATESILVTIQLKNKLLEQELLQQSDTTQTANFIYYSLLNSSLPLNISADETEHPMME